MTQGSKSKVVSIWVQLSAVFLLAAGMSATAYCQDDGDGYAMMIQTSPVDGGRLEPGTGVHRFGEAESVTLKAIPAPGYTFVYWLGSVDSPSTYETSVRIDGPKIVIAVFERSEFGLLIDDGLPSGAGRGGLVSVPSPIGMGSRARPARGAFPPPVPPPPEVNDFPVPGPNDQEPIPEPATAVLMAVGAMSMMWRNRKRGAILK